MTHLLFPRISDLVMFHGVELLFLFPDNQLVGTRSFYVFCILVMTEIKTKAAHMTVLHCRLCLVP